MHCVLPLTASSIYSTRNMTLSLSSDDLIYVKKSTFELQLPNPAEDGGGAPKIVTT